MARLIERRRPRVTRRTVVASVGVAAVVALVTAGAANLVTSRPDPLQASAYVNAGLSAQSRGNTNEAAEDYRQALAHDPRNKVAYYDLGTIQSQLGETGLAVADYDAALAIDANYEPALYNLAILLTPSAPLQAVDLYRHAIQVDPASPDTHLNLGFLLVSLGRDDEARTEFAAAVRLNPSLAARIPTSLRPQ